MEVIDQDKLDEQNQILDEMISDLTPWYAEVMNKLGWQKDENAKDQE